MRYICILGRGKRFQMQMEYLCRAEIIVVFDKYEWYIIYYYFCVDLSK